MDEALEFERAFRAYVRTIVRDEVERALAEGKHEPPNPTGFMSVKSAAKYLDVSEDTIRKWLQRGQLKRYKVRGCVRIRIAELVKLD